jgi:DNA-binding transcriptional LysR family regulator
MDLHTLSDFHLVVTHGGFGKASRASGLPKATLSRRVRELEDSLGVRLIERGSHTLHLTEEGAILHARTETPMAEIAQTAQDVRAGLGRPSGRLRVSVPVLFAHHSMGRLAAQFVAAYPEVQLDVTAEDRFVDLVEDGVDIVVRINPRSNNDLVGRCFLKDQLVLVAHPSVARPSMKGNAPPSMPAVVRTGVPDGIVWKVRRGQKELAFSPRAVLKLSSPLLVRDAVREGAGAAMVPQSVVAEDLAAGRLLAWGTSVDGQIEGWVLHASRRLVSPKITAFVNFLCDYFPGRKLKGVMDG